MQIKNNEEGFVAFLKEEGSSGYWTVERRQFNFGGPGGYIPEGLYEYGDATSVSEIVTYLCAPHEAEANSVFYLVNCSVDTRPAQELLTSVARMGQDYQDAIVLLVSSKERQEEMREALKTVPLTQFDAVFLIDMSNVVL